MLNNLIVLTDSYKASHHRQYPVGSQHVYSFFESRGGLYPTTTFFGLQYFLKRYLAKGITYVDFVEAEDYFTAHLGPNVWNKDGWRYLLDKHDGKLPIRIKAVAEGTTVPVKNVLMTVENTDPEFPWLTNYLETLLSQVWYPTTVCTQSRSMKSTLLSYLKRTGDPDGISFKLHDFGFRGSTSVESAGLGGAAHLVNFLGTDTMSALVVAREIYGEKMAGFSIPASEHSTITSWGRDKELDAYANMLEQYPSGLVACVSDSYDIYNACANLWGGALRDRILSRDGCLVVRPDSGEPLEVVPQVLEILGNKFGYTMNAKGYKVLNPHVRVIQGDGINPDSLAAILNETTAKGWSADNIAFGSGGGLLQQVNRDTCKFAFKASAIQVDGQWRDVYKEPVTDPGKNSKKGRMMLLQASPFDGVGPNKWVTTDMVHAPEYAKFDELKTVFEDGQLVGEQTFADIRKRASEGL